MIGIQVKRAAIIAVGCLAAGGLVWLRYQPPLSPPAVRVSEPAAVPATRIAVPVVGSVHSPGTVTLSQPTLREALIQARPTVLAALNRIQIVRPKTGSQSLVFNATTIMEQGGEDFRLEEGDVIVVPEKLP
jgi:hypothetical protein